MPKPRRVLNPKTKPPFRLPLKLAVPLWLAIIIGGGYLVSTTGPDPLTPEQRQAERERDRLDALSRQDAADRADGIQRAMDDIRVRQTR